MVGFWLTVSIFVSVAILVAVIDEGLSRADIRDAEDKREP